MSTTESNDRAPAQPTNLAPSPIPGDETLWEKYSPNGEPLVSGVASFMIHAIALGVVLMGLLMLFRETPTPIEINWSPPEGDGKLGGGTGNPNASSQLPGLPSQQPDVSKPVLPNTPPALSPSPGATDPERTIGPSKVDEMPPLDAEIMRRAKNPDIADLWRKLNGMSQRHGPGIKGPGDDGGAGGGKKGGIGKDDGPGTGPNLTARRMLRWELVFPMGDALHYLQQLEALGAIIAVTDRQNRVMTIHNLHERPARPTYEIVDDPDRIHWVDDRPDSAESVAEELGLSFTPGAIVAFFPRSLEKELLQKELAFRGKAENDILRTRFSISFRAGQHVIRVIEQDAKGGQARK